MKGNNKEKLDHLVKLSHSFPHYSTKKNKEMFELYEKNKDINIRNEILLHNLALIFKKVRSYNKGIVDIYDLYMYAIEGLIYAIEHFDYKINPYFSSYAYLCMDSVIKKRTRLCEKNIKLSYEDNSIINKVKVIIYEFYKNNGKYPNYMEIAKELNISLDQLIDALKNDYYFISFNEVFINEKSLDEDKPEFLYDYVKDISVDVENDAINNCSIEETIQLIKDNLTEKQAEVIIEHYGLANNEPKSLTDFAKEKNISTQAAQNRLKYGIKKLKNILSY